jgi:imidazolonepropionase-like amidohydrolase
MIPAKALQLLVVCASSAAMNAATQTQHTSDASIVALVHARVIDGTGAPAREDKTLVIERGKITRLGTADDMRVPDGTPMIDLRVRTVMPGLVMLHEHLSFDPEGPTGLFAGVAQPQPFSAPNLYLAFGVTTIRTAGTFHPYVDLNVKTQIDDGRSPGPEIFLTGPYLNGPGSEFLDENVVRSPEEARRAVRYWAGEGFTSMKAYAQLPKDALAAVIEEAHRLGLPVTAHLGGAVNCREAGH